MVAMVLKTATWIFTRIGSIGREPRPWQSTSRRFHVGQVTKAAHDEPMALMHDDQWRPRSRQQKLQLQLARVAHLMILRVEILPDTKYPFSGYNIAHFMQMSALHPTLNPQPDGP